MNETDEFGYTGLHLAAEHGHLKVVEELMVRQCSDNLKVLMFSLFFFRLEEPSLILLCLTATIFQCILQSTK